MGESLYGNVQQRACGRVEVEVVSGACGGARRGWRNRSASVTLDYSSTVVDLSATPGH